jgi:hypothetical protein
MESINFIIPCLFPVLVVRDATGYPEAVMAEDALIGANPREMIVKETVNPSVSI